MRRASKADGGRGSSGNPPNRFERTRVEYEPESEDDLPPSPQTVLIPDRARSIIATNDSPDVGFDASINPYRGCEHGCAYCYARPTHEYLGYSAGLDFETKLLVKYDAPELLRRELASPRWQPRPLAISGVTDAYQPIERRLQLTRRCLEVLAEFRNPVVVITKSRLVTRDRDLLGELARHGAAAAFVSVTTLEPALARTLEPRAASPEARLATIAALTDAGIPAGVMVAPTILGLTDHELPAILRAAAQAGARHAGCVTLRLPLGVAHLFEQWLDRYAPDRKEKVLGRLRSLRGGKLNESRFGHRMGGEGPFAEVISRLFATARRRAGMREHGPELSTAAFRRPGARQALLFEA